MRKQVVDRAELECRRLLERIQTLRHAGGESHDGDCYGAHFGDQYTAAVRRASMDLTRALADLRRG